MPHFRAIAPKGEVFPAEVDHSVVGRSWNHHSDAQWEAMKSQIVRLFIEENKSADQVVTILKEDAENSFVTSRRQLFAQLEKWGIRKNKKRPRDGDIEKEVPTAQPTIQPALPPSECSSVTQMPDSVGGDSMSQSSDPPPTQPTTPAGLQQPDGGGVDHDTGQDGFPKAPIYINIDRNAPESIPSQLESYIDAFDIEFRSVNNDAELYRLVHKPYIQVINLEGWLKLVRPSEGWVRPKLTTNNLLLLDTDLKSEMRKRMRRFRAEFIKQYDKLQQCLGSGPKTKFLSWVAYQLPAPLDVWSYAVTTMRQLTRLRDPSLANLVSVISFLLVSRAIAESAEEDRDAYLSEFAQDLENWTRVYPFIESVAGRMWNISLPNLLQESESWYEGPANPRWYESVLRLRESVASLIGKAVDLFGLDDDSNSQATNPSTPSQQDGVQDDVASLLPHFSGSAHSHHAPRKRRKVEIPQDSITPNLNRLYDLTSKDTRYSPTAVTLSTGVIFALVVYFIFTFFSVYTGAENPFGVLMNPWPSMTPWSIPGENPATVVTLVSTGGRGQGRTLWPPMLSRPSTPLAEWKPDTTTTPKSAYTAGDFHLDGEISPPFAIFS